MAEKLPMIALSPTMTEGVVARWRIAEGEAFKAGSALCEVETDKASMDYEAPRDGVLLKILKSAGGKAAVGEAIAIVGKAGEDFSALLGPSPESRAQASGLGAVAAPPGPRIAISPNAPSPADEALPRDEGSPGALVGAPALPASYPPSSPLARALARERGVDLRALRGSGPGGRVVSRDVASWAGGPGPGGLSPAPASGAAWPASTPAAAGSGATGLHASGSGATAAPSFAARGPVDQALPLSGKRAAAARRLSESFFTAPHYYLKRRVDASALLALRSASAQGRDKPVSLNAILVKLAAEAIVRHPSINSSLAEGAIVERASIDIALAVALPDGLVTPVARDCAAKGVARIEEELAALIAKAKGRGLAPQDYEGSSFTISNLGAFGVEEFTAIINPPGSAILAVGALRDAPFVRPDQSIGARKELALTLGCDHRVIDGAVGAAFLATLCGLIEEPSRALL